MTAKRKQEAVLRVLRGEPLETVARELRVTAADPSRWRDGFLAGGAASLKSRPRDDRDARIAQLPAKLGEMTMDRELLQESEAEKRAFQSKDRPPNARMEAGRPLARRRSKR